jgi:ornithine lipid ester-linked acyl 2-hydroxylase
MASIPLCAEAAPVVAEIGMGLRIGLWIAGVLGILFLLVAVFATPLLAIPYSLFLAIFAESAPYMDPKVHFPRSHKLKENWKQIRAELEQLMAGESPVPTLEQVDQVQRLFSQRDGIPWRTFFLKAFDNWVPGNCKKTPFTYSLFKDLPEVTTIMFSIMEPGKHIPGHRGIFKGILRYHLGLVIPEEGACFLDVKGQKYYWKEGEDVMFDDTYYHEAWNNSAKTRVVLFVDVKRNQSLPHWLRSVNDRAIKFFSGIKRVKSATRNAEMK